MSAAERVTALNLPMLFVDLGEVVMPDAVTGRATDALPAADPGMVSVGLYTGAPVTRVEAWNSVRRLVTLPAVRTVSFEDVDDGHPHFFVPFTVGPDSAPARVELRIWPRSLPSRLHGD